MRPSGEAPSGEAPSGTPMRPLRRAAVAALPWLAALLVLLAVGARLVSPNVMPADSGEMQLVTRELGVAHPPGYAAYTVAGHLFGRFVTATGLDRALARAAGNPEVLADGTATGDGWTLALNGFSLVLAAATMLLAGRASARVAGSLAAGVVSAAVLATAPTFLAQAGIANVRMPTALLTAAVLAAGLGLLSGRAARPVAGLVALAFCSGLAVGHHPTLLFVVVPMAAAALARQREVLAAPRALVAVASGLGLSLVPLLYLPLRDASGALLSPGTLTTPRGFLEHVTGYGFRGDLGAGGLTGLLDRAAVVTEIVARDLGAAAVALSLVGAVCLVGADGRRAAGAALACVAAIVAVLATVYRAPQTSEYLLPAYVALAILAGAGAVGVGRAAARAARQPVLAALVPPVVALVLPAMRWQLPASVVAARPDPRPTIALLAPSCTPREARVLAAWHPATTLWYAARFLQPPPSPPIAYVHPEGAEPIGATWARRLETSPDPALLTNRTREIVQSGVSLWPVGDLPGYASVPPPEAGVTCGGDWSGTRGLALEHGPVRFGRTVTLRTGPGASLRIAPSALASVVVPFEADRPVTETLTVLVQLIDPATGALWAQADHPHPPQRWSDARGLVDRLPVLPFRGRLPERLAVAVGVYRHGADGPERLVPTPLDGATVVRDNLAWLGDVPASELNTGPSLPQEGVPFGAAMVLADSRVRRRGETLVVDLTWRAARGHLSDYTVSVQARGDGWSAQHDGTPAHGMFPTLKWLPGMRVRDRHRIALPAGLAPDEAYTVTVGAYDAFSLESLPVADGALVAAGQGQAVVIASEPR